MPRGAARWRSGCASRPRNPFTDEVRHTSSAYLTMVALDDEGRPVAVPALEPQTDIERRRAQEAQVRRRHRLAERDEIDASRDED